MDLTESSQVVLFVSFVVFVVSGYGVVGLRIGDSRRHLGDGVVVVIYGL
jgi:hypothetical protein